MFVGGTKRNGEIYREPYIDANCQVWFHLAKLFQGRRLKYDEKRTKTPRLYFKIAGHVDLDKLHMFSVYTYLL
jgi:hypothetical protein